VVKERKEKKNLFLRRNRGERTIMISAIHERKKEGDLKEKHQIGAGKDDEETEKKNEACSVS